MSSSQNKRTDSHWIALTPASTGDASEVAWSEAEAQEYRDAGWTVDGPFVLADELWSAARTRDYLEEEINRMTRVLQGMGTWDAFCKAYGERYPVGTGGVRHG